jgi:hypothetical protein
MKIVARLRTCLAATKQALLPWATYPVHLRARRPHDAGEVAESFVSVRFVESR